MVICLWHSMKGCVVDTMLVLRKYLFQCFVDSNSTYCHLESSFFAYFLSAAASGDLCRSVGRNWMVSFLPRQLTCHHTQQLIRGKFINFRQLLVITCELPRQKTFEKNICYWDKVSTLNFKSNGRVIQKLDHIYLRIVILSLLNSFMI